MKSSLILLICALAVVGADYLPLVFTAPYEGNIYYSDITGNKA
jgi:hypothetical protein